MPDILRGRRFRIWQGNCLDLMSRIPDGSVDLIAADLPYGTTACKWDVVIPFAPLWAHYKRIIKPRGAIVLTASQPFTSALVMSNPTWFRHEWIWEKSRASNFQHAKRSPLRCHENILVFGEGVTTYKAQMETGAAYRTRRDDRPRISGVLGSGGFTGVVSGGEVRSDRFPRSVVWSPSMRQQDRLHPTQKPVALFEYLIRTYTNAGETVLDNTMGSGTTIIAALNTGRKSIGIEKDPEIFGTAFNRIMDHVAEKRC